MKTRIFVFLFSLLFLGSELLAFCGFYVAKADASLFNESSQVIIARQGNQTVITMQSDFEGDLKDFAMVVPVPVVLKKKQIRLVNPKIFQQLDDYSGPRLVEYHDSNPCMPQPPYMMAGSANGMIMETVTSSMAGSPEPSRYKVKIEDKYTVGGYDILILSAEESGGLEAWLIDSGYKIPKGAAEVLEPYIKDNLKFFVVKINPDALKQSKEQVLEPIQMSFESEKFGLPIRLGMANAKGDQDMVVYAFTDQGRVEVSNYRTVLMPTDRYIPTFVRARFGEFYRDLFQRTWEKEGKNIALLEYAWNISSQNYVKCDPCPSTPPAYAQLEQAGVFWAKANGVVGAFSDYQGDIYMTRLHVRYNRETFPQDLVFQATPNKQNYQGRYIMQNPAVGELSCDEGKRYLLNLRDRREKEMEELASLTGWDLEEERKSYFSPYGQALPGGEDERNIVPILPGPGSGGPGSWYWTIGLLTVLLTLSAFFLARFPAVHKP